MAPNKTDANDADGLAQLAEIGYFKQVRVKTFDGMLTRALMAARTRLVQIMVELSNQIRGVMKTFGLVVPAGRGSVFEKNVRDLLVDEASLARIVLPLLESWRSLRQRAAELSRKLISEARSVGAWLGLTTRRYQSGAIDCGGRISRRGDKRLRGLLYEAAVSILTRSQADSGLREWGLKLRERIGFMRATVAVGRKLAVLIHTMLKSGELFDPKIGATA